MQKTMFTASQEELKRLCQRSAPGATDSVGWDSGMSEICDKEYVIKSNIKNNAAFRISHSGNRYAVPFDGCILMSSSQGDSQGDHHSAEPRDMLITQISKMDPIKVQSNNPYFGCFASPLTHT